METTKFNPKWGEIYLANLGDHEGHAQGGKRPVIITSNNINNQVSPQVCCIPLTSRNKNNLPVHIMIKKSNTNGLATDSIALTEQLRPIGKDQLIKKMGVIDKEDIKALSKAIVIQNPLVSMAIGDFEFLNSKNLQKVMV